MKNILETKMLLTAGMVIRVKKLEVLWINLRSMFLRIGNLNSNQRLLKKDKKIYLKSSGILYLEMLRL